MKSLRTTALVAPLLYILALGGMAVRAGGQPQPDPAWPWPHPRPRAQRNSRR